MYVWPFPLFSGCGVDTCADENVVVYTMIDQSYNRQVVPAPFILGSTIAERQQTGVLVTAFQLGECLT